MSSELERLQDPVTEVEVAEAIAAVRKACTGHEAVTMLIRRLTFERDRLKSQLICSGGPINSDDKDWTLDELLAKLEEWKEITSGQTCVSFQCLCYGSSSLWHQTHVANFKKVDRKPKELSAWVLDYAGSVHGDFPTQVLGILKDLRARAEVKP